MINGLMFAGALLAMEPELQWVSLLKVYGDEVTQDVCAYNERLLLKLIGHHLWIEESVLDRRPIQGCMTSHQRGWVSLPVCVGARLEEMEAPEGTVSLTIAPSHDNASVEWTCTGTGRAGFDGSRQVATFNRAALDNPSIEDVQRAAQCLLAASRSGE